MEKNETKNTGQHHEDAVLKLSVQFFAMEILPYLEIEGKVVAIAPTELVQVEIHRQYQDYNLVMEDGTWKHFEFQSTNEGVSGRIENPVTEFTEGINTYRVYPIILQNKDADRLLQTLEDKIKDGEEVTKSELVPLGLTSIMGGKSSLKDRIVRSCQITQASKLINAGYEVAVDIYNKDVHKEVIGSETYEMYIVFAKKSYMEANPEITQAFVNACYKGAQYLETHSVDEICETLADQFAELADLKGSVTECKENGLWSVDGTFSDSGVEAINRMAMDSGLIAEPVAKDALINESFTLNAAGK